RQVRALTQHGSYVAREIFDRSGGVLVGANPKGVGALDLQQDRITVEQVCYLRVVNGHLIIIAPPSRPHIAIPQTVGLCVAILCGLSNCRRPFRTNVSQQTTQSYVPVSPGLLLPRERQRRG